jgi:hypothetical protein
LWIAKDQETSSGSLQFLQFNAFIISPLGFEITAKGENYIYIYEFFSFLQISHILAKQLKYPIRVILLQSSAPLAIQAK